MIIFKKNKDISGHLEALKKTGKSIAFVPTMGALHGGHLSLVQKARELADITVCSIFVNPTQFNDKEDFEKYPITIDADMAQLINAEVDLLFLPGVEEIYPENQPVVHYDLGALERILEGAFRPGHFQGVCQVVDRLLTITHPDFLVMGQKDFQQTMVIRKLLEITGRVTELITVPTLREPSGLAMSSRNARLSAAQSRHAEIIHAALVDAKAALAGHQNWSEVKADIATKLLGNGFEKYDYIELCKTSDLSTVETYNYRDSFIILLAAYIGNIRLIDNILL